MRVSTEVSSQKSGARSPMKALPRIGVFWLGVGPVGYAGADAPWFNDRDHSSPNGLRVTGTSTGGKDWRGGIRRPIRTQLLSERVGRRRGARRRAKRVHLGERLRIDAGEGQHERTRRAAERGHRGGDHGPDHSPRRDLTQMLGVESLQRDSGPSTCRDGDVERVLVGYLFTILRFKKGLIEGS